MQRRRLRRRLSKKLKLDKAFHFKKDIIAVVYIGADDEAIYIGDILEDATGSTFQIVGVEHIRYTVLPKPMPAGLILRNQTTENALPIGTLKKLRDEQSF